MRLESTGSGLMHPSRIPFLLESIKSTSHRCKFYGIGVAGGELWDVDGAVTCDYQVVRMSKETTLLMHGLQLTVEVNRWRAADV